jgi:hypothetical protein
LEDSLMSRIPAKYAFLMTNRSARSAASRRIFRHDKARGSSSVK